MLFRAEIAEGIIIKIVFHSLRFKPWAMKKAFEIQIVSPICKQVKLIFKNTDI